MREEEISWPINARIVLPSSLHARELIKNCERKSFSLPHVQQKFENRFCEQEKNYPLGNTTSFQESRKRRERETVHIVAMETMLCINSVRKWARNPRVWSWPHYTFSLYCLASFVTVACGICMANQPKVIVPTHLNTRMLHGININPLGFH